MNVRKGRQTTEFWVGILVAIAITIWPDFPKEAFAVLATWVTARIMQKTLGRSVPAKRAWHTSEFWLSIVFTIAQSVCQDLGWDVPWQSIIPVVLMILGRAGIKVTKDWQIGKPITGG